MLDETGVFGVLCLRHEVPLIACDMFKGEKFSYPDMLLAKIVEEYGMTRDYHVAYDLGCKYKAHLSTQVYSQHNHNKRSNILY